MGLDGDDDLKVPGGTAVLPGAALSPQGDDLPVVDARGDGDLEGLAPADLAGAAAVLAGGGDDLPRAAAPGARARGGEDAHGGLPPLLDLAGAAAGRAGLRAGARRRAGALAGLALLHPVDADLLLTAEGRLLEGDGQPRAQALAPLGAAPGPASAAEAAPEEAPEDVPQVPEVEAPVESAAVAAPAVAGVHPGKAELVVPGLLLAVAEDLVGLVDLLEPGLGVLVPGVQVRVVLLGQLPVCLFDLCV